jgi:MFS family permease
MPAAAFRRNVTLLALCQALYASCIALVVSTSALVGATLASDQAYAGVPYAVQLVSTMLASIPAAALMARIGRRPAFMLSAVIALLGGSLATLGIVRQDFYLFLAGNVGIGVFAGFANFYRFAAADAVAAADKSRAISYVLAGGVIAAFIGPNLANLTKDAIGNATFAGSYAATLILFATSFVLLGLLRLPPAADAAPAVAAADVRPLAVIVRQPRFIIAVLCGMLGYAVMTLVMTATPLAMQVCEYPFAETSFVIQWHILAMFAPSFFTGHLISRCGLLPVMCAGALCGLACVLINLSGTTVTHFWAALFLLGLSWNFLFIGATTLLTEAYRPAEKFKVQALNDFLVFSLVAGASLTAGILQHHYGWQVINYGALPALAAILLSLVWLYGLQRRAEIR